MKLKDFAKKRKKAKTCKCANCGGRFEYEDDYELAAEEAKQNGWSDRDDLEIVCDVCYKRMNEHFNNTLVDFTTKEIRVLH